MNDDRTSAIVIRWALRFPEVFAGPHPLADPDYSYPVYEGYDKPDDIANEQRSHCTRAVEGALTLLERPIPRETMLAAKDLVGAAGSISYQDLTQRLRLLLGIS